MTNHLITPPTPSSSLTPGSFTKLPDFGAEVERIVGLLPEDERTVIQAQQAELAEKKVQLNAALEALRESQKDYDFEDYEDRLLMSDRAIWAVLEGQIFHHDGVRTEVGEVFYGYLEAMTNGKSQELKEKIRWKLIQEHRIDDRVYERNSSEDDDGFRR